MTSHESHLSASDDLSAHHNSLRALMDEADTLIEAYESGRQLTTREQQRLGILVTQLRQKFEAQMDENDRIVHLDLEDGSYDNSAIDHRLRQQIGTLRSMDQSLNSGWLLRIPRKISGWFEDIGKWFRVTKRDVFDGASQVLKVGGVIGGGVGGAWLGATLGGPLGGVIGGAAGLLAFPVLRAMFGGGHSLRGAPSH